MPRRCEPSGRECAPDDGLREAIQHSKHRSNLDCFVALLLAITSKVGASSPHERREGGVFPLPLGEGQGVRGYGLSWSSLLIRMAFEDATWPKRRFPRPAAVNLTS